MRNFRHFFYAAVVSSISLASDVKLKSPNGEVQFTLRTNNTSLSYEVQFRGKPIIELSRMSISIDGVDLSSGAAITGLRETEKKEMYATRGVHRQATNHYRGLELVVQHGASGTEYLLELRAFNDGAAFRHVIPEGKTEMRTPEESTTFRVPAHSVVWHHDLGGHYEDVFGKSSVDAITNGLWVAPPLTFKLPAGGYAAIAEAALQNYSGMALQAQGDRVFKTVLGHAHPISYPFRLRYSNDVDRVSKPAAVKGKIVTPWRIVMVGADLNAMVNSDLVANLCAPPNPKDFPQGVSTEWVRPGRAVWKYLDGGANSFENMKDFSRWAGELGFEYHVIEGFWSRWSDDQIKELVDFSRERGVGIWLWRHSRELRNAEAQDAFFDRLQRLGVVGAKIDFFDHEHKEVVDLYTTLLEKAAQRKILVNFHGSNKPTGEWRTWPNEMIRESVRGMEASRLKERAQHNVTLPFTRYLAGHGDYTPVHFGARRGDTTWAHQIATASIFNEPLLTYGAHPTNLLQNPALEMIKLIPAVWDETIVLPPSEIGEAVLFARRTKETWFVAALNGAQKRDIKVPLSFLRAGSHSALLVFDDDSKPDAVKVERRHFKPDDSLNLQLTPGGGFIGRFAATNRDSALKVFTLDASQIERSIAALNQSDDLAPALAALKRDADAALKVGPFTIVDEFVPASGDKHDYMSQAPYFWRDPTKPDGLPYIRRDGERNPEINKYPDLRVMDEMVEAVETLALAWKFTGDEKYAVKARELLFAWFVDAKTRMNPNLQHAQFIPGINTGRGIGLIETRGLTRVVDAVGLLAGSKSWTDADQKSIETWFGKFLDWMIESKNGRDEAAAKNNHGTYYDIQVISFALFTGRTNFAKTVAEEARTKRIAVQIEPDGRQPLELVRTKAWSYSTGNLRGLMTLARLAEHVGVDLWRFETADGRSIRKAVDYLIPFAFTDAKWPHQQIGGFSKDALFPVVRIAASNYDEPQYRELVAQVSKPRADSRQRLLQGVASSAPAR